MEIGSDIIRGHIDAIILGFVKDKDRYGYEILKLITEKSYGEYEIKEPSLYSAIRRLEEQKLIEGYWGDETQGGRRKYYRITEEGKISFKKELMKWDFAKKVIDRLLKTDGDSNENNQ